MPPTLGLRYSLGHGTAHRIGAKLFADGIGRPAFLRGYVPVFLEFCVVFCPTRILADFAFLGFGDARSWGSLARQHEAAKLHPDGGNYRLANQSRDPLAARRNKTGV